MKDTSHTAPTIQDAQAQALLEGERVRARSTDVAYRSHTPVLFALWLVSALVIIFTVYRVASQSQVSITLVLAIAIALLGITGAYIHQEIRRIHQRIDAILNLIEKK